VKQIEALSGARIGELSVPTSTALRIRNRNILYSLVPISGGAMGAVLMFREADPMILFDVSHRLMLPLQLLDCLRVAL